MSKPTVFLSDNFDITVDIKIFDKLDGNKYLKTCRGSTLDSGSLSVSTIRAIIEDISEEVYEIEGGIS
jgi:hypothetical protein